MEAQPRRTNLRRFWKRKKIVITAGPTREALDPVRFLTNASSGKMGYAVAAAAARAGARVILISGPTALPCPPNVRRVSVVSARDMRRAALRWARGADLFVGAAAVADWRPARFSGRKIKKQGRAWPRLTLRPNPDILRSVTRLRRRPRVVGFALETENLLRNAERKMKEKSLDMVVANGPEVIDRETTAAFLLRPGRPVRAFRRISKTRLAWEILTTVTP